MSIVDTTWGLLDDAEKGLLRQIGTMLINDGFDVIGYGWSDDYNKSVRGVSSDLALLPEKRVVICVGNSRVLWPHAEKLLRAGEPDPFNMLSSSAAQKCERLCSLRGVPNTIFFSHLSSPFLVSFQHLAISTSIGVLHSPSQLVVHHTYGPWIGLRFAIVLKLSMENICLNDLNENSEFSLDASESAAVAMVLQDQPYNALLHIAARRAFSTGAAHAYSDEQLSYHYHIPLSAVATCLSDSRVLA